MLSLVYGTFRSAFLGSCVTTTNHLCVEDTSAFLLIALSVKRRGSDRAPGVPSLIDKILQDATMYFLVIFSTHLLLILFEFFAPVSPFSNGLFPSTHDELHVETESAPPCGVSHPP